jgi:hypothetical protein
MRHQQQWAAVFAGIGDLADMSDHRPLGIGRDFLVPRVEHAFNIEATKAARKLDTQRIRIVVCSRISHCQPPPRAL